MNPRKRKTTKPKVKPETQVSQISIAAIPELYNQQMLKWMQTFYDALKTLHEDMDEVKELLKE